MRRKILYINFESCSYASDKEFFAQQRSVLLFKVKLSELHQVTYLLNNNLNLDLDHHGLKIRSTALSRLRFLIYSLTFARRENIDVIIVHGLSFLVCSFFLKSFLSARIIYQHHGEKPSRFLYFPFFDKYVDAYFFNGKGVARDFIRKGIGSEKIVEVVEGTTDFQCNEQGGSKDFKKIIVISRLNPGKNIFTILDAISILASSRKDFRVSIYYSSAEQEKELVDITKDKALDELVAYKGEISHKDIESVLNTSDIYLSASLQEAGGFALIEAMACGVFPVVSDIAAFKYLVQDLDMSRRFSARNSEELAAVLSKVLDLDWSSVVRQRIRKHFEIRASPNAIADQISSVLNKILLK